MAGIHGIYRWWLKLPSEERQKDRSALGRRLEYLRRQRGWTIAGLAKRMGKGQQEIRFLEKGAKPVTWEMLERFAEQFETTAENLINQAAEEALEMLSHRAAADPEWAIILEQLAGIDAPAKEILRVLTMLNEEWQPHPEK